VAMVVFGRQKEAMTGLVWRRDLSPLLI